MFFKVKHVYRLELSYLLNGLSITISVNLSQRRVEGKSDSNINPDMGDYIALLKRKQYHITFNFWIMVFKNVVS